VLNILPSLLNGEEASSDILEFDSFDKLGFSSDAESSLHEPGVPSLNSELLSQFYLSYVKFGCFSFNKFTALCGIYKCNPDIFIVPLNEELEASGHVGVFGFGSPLLEFVDFH
jgi:hypothetical protein